MMSECVVICSLVFFGFVVWWDLWGCKYKGKVSHALSRDVGQRRGRFLLGGSIRCLTSKLLLYANANIFLCANSLFFLFRTVKSTHELVSLVLSATLTMHAYQRK